MRQVSWLDKELHEEDYPKNLTWLKRHLGDPISRDEDGKFWFSDETWTEVCGPYETMEEVKKAVGEYADTL